MLLCRTSRNAPAVREHDGVFDWTRGLDRFFEDVLTPMASGSFAADVRQEGSDLVVEAELPGLSKEQVNITVEDGVLTIAAEVNKETEEKNEHYYVRERRTGQLQRSFRLPPTADGEKINATLENGLLTLRIPTREEAKPRRIAVQ